MKKIIERLEIKNVYQKIEIKNFETSKLLTKTILAEAFNDHE